MTLYAMLAVPREGGNSGTIFFIQMAVIFAIFYFLLLRPQAKERQRHDKMLKELKKGDEIITNGGIIGRVVHEEGGHAELGAEGVVVLDEPVSRAHVGERRPLSVFELYFLHHRFG